MAEALPVHTPVEWAVVSFCRAPDGFALESTAVDPTYGDYTILGFEPIATVCAEAGDADPIGRLAARAGRGPLGPLTPTVPFAGGWVGFISYEAGLGLDRIVAGRKCGRLVPDLRFNLYDTVAVYEHATGQWYAAGVDWGRREPVPHDTPPRRRSDARSPRDSSGGVSRLPRPGVRDRFSRVKQMLGNCRQPPAMDCSRPVCAFPEPNMTREEYLAKMARAKCYIEAGDVYEVNLTQRFSASVDAPPLDVYRRLRSANPAWFSAYLAWDDRAILSASPELFLDLRGGRVVTRPIKGTRPRTGDELLDAARRQELVASEKDRAELTMIIDLMRNDLGRVCRFGSVRVTSDGEIEAHPTVYHRVATIVGTLADGRDWADLLRATFPGGSVTGAPKIRAMQIIDELEPTPREVYCGAIGYIGLDGSMVMNLAIRTMILCGRSLHLYAGGAIVADSDPEDEYDETMAKAAGMLRALGHDVFAEAWPGR